MIIHFTLNGAPQGLTVNPGENVQKLLFGMGMHSVRNSDDGFGFAGSDAILFNGNIVNASLLIAAQLEKANIRTAESLGKWNELSRFNRQWLMLAWCSPVITIRQHL